MLVSPAKFCNRIRHFIATRRGDCALHDPLAAMLAMNPDLAKYEEYPVFIELNGDLTRGMTVAERRGSQIKITERSLVKIATSVDPRGAVQRMTEALSA